MALVDWLRVVGKLVDWEQRDGWEFVYEVAGGVEGEI
jgi:hypothetical protein